MSIVDFATPPSHIIISPCTPVSMIWDLFFLKTYKDKIILELYYVFGN